MSKRVYISGPRFINQTNTSLTYCDGCTSLNFQARDTREELASERFFTRSRTSLSFVYETSSILFYFLQYISYSNLWLLLLNRELMLRVYARRVHKATGEEFFIQNSSEMPRSDWINIFCHAVEKRNFFNKSIITSWVIYYKEELFSLRNSSPQEIPRKFCLSSEEKFFVTNK